MREGPRSPLPEGYRKLAPLEVIREDDLMDYGFDWMEAGFRLSGDTVLGVNSVNGEQLSDFQFARKIEQPTQEKEWLNPWD